MIHIARRRSWRFWSAGIAVVAAVTIGGTAAFAGNGVLTHIDSMYRTSGASWLCGDGGGDTDIGFCQTDNSSVTWHAQSSVTATGRSNIANRMSNQFAPTDLNVSQTNSPSYSGGSETDIIYQQGTSGVSQDGVAWCNDGVTSIACDQHYVRFRSATPGRSIACHETGHTIGLTHGNDADPRQSQTYSEFGCMKTPTGGTQVLTATLTSQINATY